MTKSLTTRMIRSSAFFLAISFITLGLSVLVLFAAALWYAWNATIIEGRTELLQKDTQHLAAVYQHEGVQSLATLINTRVDMKIAGERVLLLADTAKHPIAGNVPAWPDNVPNANGIYNIAMPLNGQPAQVVVVRTTLPNGYSLLVGRDLSLFSSLETRFIVVLFSAAGILSLFGVLGGIILRRALMSRIQNIGQTVSAIMQGDLGHRLKTRSSGDELDTLSLTINQMLDQIELLVHGIRNVSNAIAHDLRTPLAELRSRLEELATTQPPPQETFIEIDGAVADVDRVIRIFNALLRLAEIDAGMRRSGFIQVNITSIIAEAIDFYRPATDLKGTSLTFRKTEPIMVTGDPILLAQAIVNLIDNAMKYVQQNGNITVKTTQEDGKTYITVADSGPGIPDAEKPKVVERFFRGAVASDIPGIGLGLTLVEAVARLHGGRLDLTDNHPGLRATIVLG